MKRLILLSSLALLLVCCNRTGKVIFQDNLEKDVISIKKSLNSTELDSFKINVLDELISYSKDLEYFKKSLNKRLGSDNTLSEYLVSEDAFKENSEKLFKELKDKKYTFKQLFKEIEGIYEINEKYYKELEPIYKEIDSLCSTFQLIIDENEKKAEIMKDSLNKIVDLKLISITKTEIDYSDVIAVRIQMINKTNRPIEALSFAVTLTDKLGSEIATLNCKTNDRFVKSDIGLWTFERFGNRSDIYDELLNVNASHVSLKQVIKKVNLDGELIGSELDNLQLNDHFQYIVNLHYKTPKNRLNGFCGYLDTDNPYSEKEKEIEKRKEAEIENGNFPILKRIGEIEIYDFDKE